MTNDFEVNLKHLIEFGKGRFKKYPYTEYGNELRIDDEVYALFGYVSQMKLLTDEMIDNLVNMTEHMNNNFKGLNIRLDDFIKNFDGNLHSVVVDLLRQWQLDGSLEIIIDEALQTQLDKLQNKEIHAKDVGLKGDGSDETDLFVSEVNRATALGVWFNLDNLNISVKNMNLEDGLKVKDGGLVRLETMNTVVIGGDNDIWQNVTFDGKKLFGMFLQYDNKSGFKFENCLFKDNLVDGVYIRGSHDFVLLNNTSIDNDRNGCSITDDCHDFYINGWNSTNDIVAGIDIEPNATSVTNVKNFIIENVFLDNSELSLYGYSNTIYIENGIIRGIHAVNNSIINITRLDGLVLSDVFLDDTSNLWLSRNVGGGYGGSHVSVSNVLKTNKPTNETNKLTNGDFSNELVGYTVAKTGTDVVVELSNSDLFGGSCLHVRTLPATYGFVTSEYISVQGGTQIVVGGSIKALLNRPYIQLEFKSSTGGTILQERKLSVKRLNAWQNVLYVGDIPIDATVMRLFLGGTATEQVDGYFDGLFVYKNAYKFEF